MPTGPTPTPISDSSLQIRRATRADLDGWAALRHKLWPDAPLDELRAELEPFLAAESDFALLAFLPGAGDLPIGLIEMSVRDSAYGSEGRPIPYIEGWYVEPGYRTVGIGGALVRAAEAWARSAGYSEIASDTTHEYPGSPAAHAALGFETVHISYHFHKRL
jgi:aminoglycoside 6'-N-acetyltransferase I